MKKIARAAAPTVIVVCLLACLAAADYAGAAPPNCVTAQCHARMAKEKHLHGPVASGDCTTCHQPTGKAHPAEKGAFKLADTGAKLCFSCHDSANFIGKTIHEPVRAGACTSCHDPHGSDFPHLLANNYPDELYLPYQPENYAFCFDCHGADLAKDRRTDTLTSFRNGDRNLHYTHVNNPVKGRSCRVCHHPHASSQAKLINEKVASFGKWDIPINFTKTDTGGSCMVGCHKPLSYDRLKPVQY
jgi:predicted CXXCH cytochrome family protein